MGINLQSAAEVRELFLTASRANREAACRQGSIDVIRPPGVLVATGDLHDNPVNFARLVNVAGMADFGFGISDFGLKDAESGNPHPSSAVSNLQSKIQNLTWSSTKSSTPTG